MDSDRAVYFFQQNVGVTTSAAFPPESPRRASAEISLHFPERNDSRPSNPQWTAAWYAKPDEFYRRQALVPKDEAYGAVGDTVLAEPPNPNRRGRFYLYCRQNGTWPKEVTGHDPHLEPKWFDPHCPIRNLTAQYPPTFLIHGTADTDVPYEESKNMADKLKEVDVEHEFVTVQGAGHGLSGAKPEEVARIAGRAASMRPVPSLVRMYPCAAVVWATLPVAASLSTVRRSIR